MPRLSREHIIELLEGVMAANVADKESTDQNAGKVEDRPESTG